jgi:hypothetical protein
VGRVSWLLFTLLAGASGIARAQEVRPSAPRPELPRLAIEFVRNAEGQLQPPQVGALHLMDDGVFDAALHNGFPVRYHFRLELWRDQRIFDHLERDVAWDALVRLDPLTNEYTLVRSGGTQETFTTVDAMSQALATAFTVDLLPSGGDHGHRYYYVASLEIESLSLSELEEVERWLRGDLGRAIEHRGDVGDALSRGARRLLIRFSGLPRRRLEARTGTFDY